MRKAVSSATRRSKDRRKDDDLPQSAAPPVINGILPREEPPTDNNNNISQAPAAPPVKSSANNNHNTNNGNKDYSQSTGQEQRKLTNDEASLQAKNYRLAKELSEVRVRHREECKHVTRLTMENMNLASRCREAMSHVAVIKKELTIQKKKAAEAIAMQKKLSKQLALFQQNNKEQASTTSTNSTSSSSPESPIEPSLSESGKMTKANNITSGSKEDHASRQRIVSEDSSIKASSLENGKIADTNNNINTEKEDLTSRHRIVSVDSPINSKKETVSKSSKKYQRRNSSGTSPLVTDVAAEMDRMDQILAEHQEKIGNHLEANADSSSPSKKSKESRKKDQLVVKQIIVDTVINHQQPPDDEILEKIISVAANAVVKMDADIGYSNNNNEHKSGIGDVDNPSSVMPSTNSNKKEHAQMDNLETITLESKKDGTAEQITSSLNVLSTPAKQLVSSDDYEVECSFIESPKSEDSKSTGVVDDDRKHTTLNDSSDLLMTAVKEEQGAEESLLIVDDGIDNNYQAPKSPPVSSTKKFFPYSASPKIEFPLRGAMGHQHYPRSSNYDEEFPEDIAAPMSMRRRNNADWKLRMPTLSSSSINANQLLSEDEKVPTSASSSASGYIGDASASSKITAEGSQVMSSIDAFEASFNINFPDSFSPREAIIEEEGEFEEGKSQANSDIYNPFAASPVRVVEHVKVKEKRVPDLRHEEFINDTSMPIFPLDRSMTEINNDENIEKQPLLVSTDNNVSAYRGFSLEMKTSSNQEVPLSYGSSIRDRATAAYKRTSSRGKKTFYDPPGKDHTSPRTESRPSNLFTAGNNEHANSRKSMEPSIPKPAPYHSDITMIDELGFRQPDKQLQKSTNKERFISNVSFRPQIERKMINQPADKTISPSSSTSSSTKKQMQQAQHHLLEEKVQSGPPAYQLVSSKVDSLIVAPRRSSLESSNVKKDCLSDQDSVSSAVAVTPKSDPPAHTFLVSENPATPERKVVSKLASQLRTTEPTRPEKQGFDSARARYERALGLPHQTLVINTASTDGNRDDSNSKKASSSTGSSGNAPNFRDRVAKFEDSVSSTTPSNAASNLLAISQKEHRNVGTSVALRSRQKLGAAVTSIGSLISSVVSRPAEDDGDIPMRSSLSPNKDKPVNTSTDVSLVSPTKSYENRGVNVQRNLFDEGDIPLTKGSSYVRARPRLSKESNTKADKFDSSVTSADVTEDDDIVEVPRETSLSAYDSTAGGRLTMNANKPLQRVMIGRNNNVHVVSQQQHTSTPVSSSSKQYRRTDLYQQARSSNRTSEPQSI